MCVPVCGYVQVHVGARRGHVRVLGPLALKL